MPGHRDKRWRQKFGPWGARSRLWLRDERDYDADERVNLFALIFVVLLVVLSVWLLNRFQQVTRETDCFLAGHRDCTSVFDSVVGVTPPGVRTLPEP
jgi:hypothetical protein